MNELNTAKTVAENYIATWNETDAATRRAQMEKLWTENATYLDPLMQGSGQDAIDGLIAGVHGQFPGYRFTLVGAPEQVGQTVRFSWHLGPEDKDQAAPVGGTDFCTLADDGRLQNVTGFLDFAPGLSQQ